MLSAPPRALRSTTSTSSSVHNDVAEVAEEPQPTAVGRQVEDLVLARAVEEHGVGAGLALDRVAAVARVPPEEVVAGAEQSRCRCPGCRR